MRTEAHGSEVEEPASRRMSVTARRVMRSFVASLSRGLVSDADQRRRERRGSFIGTLELRAAVDAAMEGRVGLPSSSSSSSSSSSYGSSSSFSSRS